MSPKRTNPLTNCEHEQAVRDNDTPLHELVETRTDLTSEQAPLPVADFDTKIGNLSLEAQQDESDYGMGSYSDSFEEPDAWDKSVHEEEAAPKDIAEAASSSNTSADQLSEEQRLSTIPEDSGEKSVDLTNTSSSLHKQTLSATERGNPQNGDNQLNQTQRLQRQDRDHSQKLNDAEIVDATIAGRTKRTDAPEDPRIPSRNSSESLLSTRTDHISLEQEGMSQGTIKDSVEGHRKTNPGDAEQAENDVRYEVERVQNQIPRDGQRNLTMSEGVPSDVSFDSKFDTMFHDDVRELEPAKQQNNTKGSITGEAESDAEAQTTITSQTKPQSSSTTSSCSRNRTADEVTASELEVSDGELLLTASGLAMGSEGEVMQEDIVSSSLADIDSVERTSSPGEL